jgi:hypothetical protein
MPTDLFAEIKIMNIDKISVSRLVGLTGIVSF